MRDFRDAKSMAQSLRAALAAKGHRISIAESLELIAKAFGAADWNTLSAMIPPAGGHVEPVPPPPRPDPLIQRAFDRVRFSRDLEVALHRAVAAAQQRRHSTSTLEHLLLALVDDPHAVAVLEACNIRPDELRPVVASFVDQAYAPDDDDQAPHPSPGFERVVQRAVIHAQASDRAEITGANVLVAIFSERESQARRFLDDRGMTRYDAVNFIAHGIPKGPGGAAV